MASQIEYTELTQDDCRAQVFMLVDLAEQNPRDIEANCKSFQVKAFNLFVRTFSAEQNGGD
jgi:hypothetical protein